MTTVKIDGLRELDAMLGELPKAAAKAVLRRVGIKALQPMAEAWRGMVPDDPSTPAPDYKSSITVGTKLNKRQASMAKNDEGKAFVTVYVGTNDPAGVQLEFGNVNMGPQPSARPAFDQEARGAIDIVANELGDEIKKTVARRAKRAANKAAKG